MNRITITNTNYGYDGTKSTGGKWRKTRISTPRTRPWMVHQVHGGNRTYATFAQAVEFVRNGARWDAR